jgi:hypothetical protein
VPDCTRQSNQTFYAPRIANPLAVNGDNGIAAAPEVASISFGERLEKLTGS